MPRTSLRGAVRGPPGISVPGWTCVFRANSAAGAFGNGRKTLWAAVVALEESANLVRAVKDQFPEHIAEALEEQAQKKVAQAREICRILESLEVFRTE